MAIAPKPVPRFRGPAAGANQPTVPEQADLADLRKKYLDIDFARLNYQRSLANPPQRELTPQEKANAKRLEARANVIGTQSAKAEVNLPQLETSANTAIKEVSDLLNHPGFGAAVGLPNPFKGGFGIGTARWTPARGFVTRLEKAKAGAFLQAREGLKGAGQVTDYEGQKAEKALAAMETATSEEDFRLAAQEYVNAIANGVKIARKVARMNTMPYSYEELMAEKARRSGGR